MKKILLGMLLMLLVIAIAASAILGYLFVMKNNEAADLNNQITDLKNKQSITLPPPPPVSTATNLNFIDDGQGIKMVYPSSWNGVFSSKISSDFAYTPEYGKVISKYVFTLTKSGSTLTFQKILGAVDGFPSGLSKSTSDFVEVTPKLVRYSDKGKNDWKYVAKIDCSSASSPGGSLTGSDECVSAFFPGFGTNDAAVANLKASDPKIIAEADEIAKSVLNP